MNPNDFGDLKCHHKVDIFGYISWQLLGYILTTLVISWLSLMLHQQFKFLTYLVKYLNIYLAKALYPDIQSFQMMNPSVPIPSVLL